jgi:hypothetical protein
MTNGPRLPFNQYRITQPVHQQLENGSDRRVRVGLKKAGGNTFAVCGCGLVLHNALLELLV